jgi:hypothetical protein
MNMNVNYNTTLVNYRNDSTSVSDSFYTPPTELTDNLSYAIKNNIIIDYSFAEIEKSDVNKEPEKKIEK